MAEYINTYTGVLFDPTEPVMENIRIEDIAHALSLICRGNGQVKLFYSVGEHCVNCAREAMARGYSGRVALACLLHDASESYMSDVPRPFKKYLKDYRELENRLLSMIYQHFLGGDLSAEEAAQVKSIDDDLLAYDLFYLLNVGTEETLPVLKQPYVYGNREFEKTEREYLELFETLSGMLENE